MPNERPSVRGVSGVGRFAGAAPPTRVRVSIDPNDGGTKKGEVEEGGCRRWFRKMCPCCCNPRPDDSYDVTDKVEVVPFTPSADKDPPKFLPLVNGNELEGELPRGGHNDRSFGGCNTSL